MPVSITVRNTRKVQRVLETFPLIASSAMNRQYKGVARDFSEVLAKGPLATKGVYKVTRKGKARPVPRGQPKLHARTAKAGFRSRIGGLRSLDEKTLSFRTSNPLLVQREHGGPPITPKNKPYLAIPIPKTQQDKRIIGTGRYAEGRLKSIIFTKKSIPVRPVLGFHQLWEGQRQAVRARLNKGVADAVRRIQLQLAKPRRRRRA